MDNFLSNNIVKLIYCLYAYLSTMKPLLKITFKKPEMIFCIYGNFICEFVFAKTITNRINTYVIEDLVIKKEKIKSIEFIQPNEL